MNYSNDISDRIQRTHDYTAKQDTDSAVIQAKLAHHILDEIIAFTRPGVKESEVREYALSRFEAHDIESMWHPPYIRFGEHTLLTFMDKAKEDFILQEHDIAFIDIGIVKNGIEGDAGRSFTYGNDPICDHLISASQTLFHEARDFWEKNNPIGTVLYEHIHATAKKMNVHFILDPAGHLIGTFPHKGWKRGLNHFPEYITSGTWILEIQIRHPEKSVGAFYEDLLYSTF